MNVSQSVGGPFNRNLLDVQKFLDSESSDSSDEVGRDPCASPPPKCPICLEKCKKKCFTNSCLHQFCFKCLSEWSKVKPECPLCKQVFKTIIHNVKSIDKFDEFIVEQRPRTPSPPVLEEHVLPRNSVTYANRFDVFLSDLPRFSGFAAAFEVYPSSRSLSQFLANRSTLTERFRQQYPDGILPTGNIVQCWRQYIYFKKLYALPVVDITGRYRECSARFYRANPAQVHRLMPWLHRELVCLLRGTVHDPSFVLHLLVQLLTIYNINSALFRRRCTVFIGSRTSHFIHEFFTFARSPYDMIGFDRQALYVPFQEIILSSDSENESNNIENGERTVFCHQNNNLSVVLPNSTLTNSGSSTATLNSLNTVNADSGVASNGRTNNIPTTTTSANTSEDVNLINSIESTSSSDDCEFVLEQKPPHLRTPELISLNSESDSDVVFVNETKPTELSVPRQQFLGKRHRMRSRRNNDTKDYSSDEESVESSNKIRILKRKMNSVSSLDVNEGASTSSLCTNNDELPSNIFEVNDKTDSEIESDDYDYFEEFLKNFSSDDYDSFRSPEETDSDGSSWLPGKTGKTQRKRKYTKKRSTEKPKSMKRPRKSIKSVV